MSNLAKDYKPNWGARRGFFLYCSEREDGLCLRLGVIGCTQKLDMWAHDEGAA